MSVRRALLPTLLVAALSASIAAVPTSVAGSGPSAASPEARRWLPQATGTWSVVRVADDAWQVTWRAADRLPVGSDQPRIVSGDTDLGPVTLGRGGRSVSVVVRGTQRPRTATLDVLLSGDRLDEPGDDLAAARASGDAADSGVPAALTPLPEDPATPGPYGVVTSDYSLSPLPVAGMPQPIEMVGHVVEPEAAATTGPRPLVLFMHGRHSYCYKPGSDDTGDGEWPCSGRYREIPSHLGYDYVQRVLASQGFTTVSVRVNGINAQDWALPDGGATARATVVAAHLDHWTSIAAEHQVDLSRVVLVGHSRGGEGVNRASIRIPLSAPYRIVGQVLLAPTDFGTQTAPYVPTVTVLPYCDGDVFDLQGQRFTDVGRDLAPGDTSLKSSVLVMGANHNFFNTEWTPGLAVAPAWDDWGDTGTETCGTANPERLSPQEQQAAGTATIVGAARMFARGESQWLPLFDGSGATVASLGDHAIYSHAVGGGRDVRSPRLDSGRSMPVGATTAFCKASEAGTLRSCGRHATGVAPHWSDSWEGAPLPTELEMGWTAPGQSGGLVFDTPLDVTGKRVELRVAPVAYLGVASLDVRLTDSTGSSATLRPVVGADLEQMPGSSWDVKVWARTLVVDPSPATDVDLTDIVQVDLVSRSAEGRVWLLDVAAASDELTAPQERRLPYVELGRARIPEGDGRHPVTASLPYRVVGTLTRPATFRVSVGWRLGGGTYDVALAPGQDSGALEIAYWTDEYYGPNRQIYASAWGVEGVGTGRWVGRLRIIDDDPRPRLTVTAPRVVTEGEKAIVRLQLHHLPYSGENAVVTFVPGPSVRPPVRVADVSLDWLVNLAHRVPKPTKRLNRLGIREYVFLGRGAKNEKFAVPTRADSRSEKTEEMTLEIRFMGQTFTRTIRVRDA